MHQKLCFRAPNAKFSLAWEGGGGGWGHTHLEKLCLDSNGRRTQVSSAEEIGQVFNDFFVNVGPNLASNIQKATNGNSFRDYLCDQGKGTLNFNPITEYEVQCQLLSLNVNKACGHDTNPS